MTVVVLQFLLLSVSWNVNSDSNPFNTGCRSLNQTLPDLLLNAGVILRKPEFLVVFGTSKLAPFKKNDPTDSIEFSSKPKPTYLTNGEPGIS